MRIINAADHGASKDQSPEFNGEVLRRCVQMAVPGDVVYVPDGHYRCVPMLHVPRGVSISTNQAVYGGPVPNRLLAAMSKIWNFTNPMEGA